MKFAPLLLVATFATAFAADDAPAPKPAPKPKPVAFLNAADAGEDFALQGEYASTTAKQAAHVIALGDDNFEVVLYPGGLPGAGWDKSAVKRLRLKRANGELRRDADAAGPGIALSRAGLRLTEAGGAATDFTRTERRSPTMGAKPPAGAKILFDGSSVEAWAGGKLVDLNGEKLLRCGTKTKEKLGAGTLHIEFLLPFKPMGRGQDRGNSGVYLQDRYEVQVLDSFGLKGENNECGGVYTVRRPDVNMCLPPLQWQTYDIDFEPARFGADGVKTSSARLTVRHNGVLIHERVEASKPTAAAGNNKEDSGTGPIQLQDHGNPVHYRNIWFAPAN